MNWDKISEFLKDDIRFYLLIFFIFAINLMGLYYLYKFIKRSNRGGMANAKSGNQARDLMTQLRKAIALLRESDRYLDESEAILKEVKGKIPGIFKNKIAPPNIQALINEVEKLMENAQRRLEVTSASSARVRADSDDEI